MNAKEYIELVLKTESNAFGEINTRLLSTKIIRLLHASIGLNTEQAEFADALKKFIFYGRPIDEINLKEEIGDLFWYLAIACKELDVSFEEIWETNIAKLKARYGISFNKDGAVSRNLTIERYVLEKNDVILHNKNIELCNQFCELEKQIGKHFKSDHYAHARGEFK